MEVLFLQILKTIEVLMSIEPEQFTVDDGTFLAVSFREIILYINLLLVRPFLYFCILRFSLLKISIFR